MEAVAHAYVAERFRDLLNGDSDDAKWFAARSTGSISRENDVAHFASPVSGNLSTAVSQIFAGEKIVAIAQVTFEDDVRGTATVTGSVQDEHQTLPFVVNVIFDRSAAEGSTYFIQHEAWSFFASQIVEVVQPEAQPVAQPVEAAAVEVAQPQAAAEPTAEPTVAPAAEEAKPEPEPTPAATSEPTPTKAAAPAATPAPAAAAAPAPAKPVASGWAGVAAKARDKPMGATQTRVVASAKPAPVSQEPVPEPEKPEVKPKREAAPKPAPKPERPKVESSAVFKVASPVSDDDVTQALPPAMRAAVVSMRNKSADLGRVFIDFSVGDAVQKLVGLQIAGKPVNVEVPRPK